MNPNEKLTPAEAVAALRALSAHPAYAHNADAAYAVRYTELTGIVPPWLTAFAPNGWSVSHDGCVYGTTATSEADAVNRVRWRIAGETPEAALAPFYAVCPALIVAEAVAKARGERTQNAPARTQTVRPTITPTRPATTPARPTRRTATAQPAISKADAILRLRKLAAG